jgi:hypothetical protein
LQPTGFSRLLGFDEFDVLMVIGLPVISSPGGAIGGVVLGSLRRSTNAYRNSTLCAIIPAVIYFFIGISQQELSKKASTQFVAVTSVTVFMIASAAIGILVFAKVYRAIFNAKLGGLVKNNSIN